MRPLTVHCLFDNFNHRRFAMQFADPECGRSMTSESVPLADFSTAAAKRDCQFAAIPNYRTLPEIVAANRALHSEYPALFSMGGSITIQGCLPMPYAFAAVLRGSGVRTGDRIVVNLPELPGNLDLLSAMLVPGGQDRADRAHLTIDELNFVISGR